MVSVGTLALTLTRRAHAPQLGVQLCLLRKFPQMRPHWAQALARQFGFALRLEELLLDRFVGWRCGRGESWLVLKSTKQQTTYERFQKNYLAMKHQS